MNILDQLAEYAQIRVDEAKKKLAFDEVKKLATGLSKGSFEFVVWRCIYVD